MRWNNLKSLTCPKCEKDLDKDGHMFKCTKECGFSVYDQKLRSMVESMFTKNNDYEGRAEFEELMEGI